MYKRQPQTTHELAQPSRIAQVFKTCSDELRPIAQAGETCVAHVAPMVHPVKVWADELCSIALAVKTCADELSPIIAQAGENMRSSCSSYSSSWAK